MDSKNANKASTDRLLRLPDVLARIPISRSRWYAGVKSGEYPAPIKISANISAWRSEDIDALLQKLCARCPDEMGK